MMIVRKETAKSDYVIENKKGERMSIRSYQYMFEKLTERAGVRKLNFHALRHTFATRAIECGMDIKTLSEIMGHKNASITLNRYAHSMMDTKIEMMNGILQKKDALVAYLSKKHRGMIEYVGQVRNAADHGSDADEGGLTWLVTDETAVLFPSIVAILIKGIYDRSFNNDIKV